MTEDYLQGYADAMNYAIENRPEPLPAKQWVGLDAEDLDEIDSDALLANCSGDHAAMAIVVAVMVEAKLKEKNT